MGYSYPGFGLRTKIDFSRQVYQNCDTTAEMSGNGRLQQTVLINKSGTSLPIILILRQHHNKPFFYGFRPRFN